MERTILRALAALIAPLLLLSGCAGQPAPAEETAPAPAASQAVSPSPAPSPAPSPTSAPSPSPTPELVRTLTVYGREFSSADTEIDLSGVPITDGGEELLSQIDAFPRLEKVVMCECGLSDEEMDRLDRAYDGIRFVWTVHIGKYELRTDAAAFIAPLSGSLGDSVEALKYCRDLVALDLGHKVLTDVSFVSGMPHLRFLILADNPVADISALAKLEELEYLELFLTNTADLTPLLACRKLKDLNICYIPRSTAENAWEVLMQMPWLERLFYAGNGLTVDQQNALRDSFPPESEIVLYDGIDCTGLDWRYHERYYEMRDLLGMYYMLDSEKH